MPQRHRRRTQPLTSTEPPDIYDILPPGFTFQGYIDGSPPVNGHYMALFAANGGGRRVHLPCKVISFNEETKTAIVRATDGVEITVVDINVPIKNLCLEIWGLPTAATVLSAVSMESLPDDHNFDKAQWFIEYLLKPSTWGEVAPPETVENHE